MAESQIVSAKKGKKPTKNVRRESPKESKPDELPTTKRDALAILSSGVRACQDTGIAITHKMYQGYVLLAIPEADITTSDDGILFVPANPIVFTGTN